MGIKKSCQTLLLGMCCYLSSVAVAQNPLGQTLQINMNFRSIVGKPSWLLVIRDVESGQVIPYLFEIRKNQHFWIAFTYGRSYRVTASTLVFGPYAEITNFCHLENGVLSGTSMFITLKGELTPDPSSSKCYVRPFQDSYFTIVNHHLF